MTRIDLTKTNYGEQVFLPSEHKIKKKKIIKISSILLLLILICIFVFFARRYADKPAVTNFEDKINMSINLGREILNTEGYDKDYVLIKFPDNDQMITKDDYMIFNGKKLKQFSKGYIILYKDSSIAFKVSDGTYCGSKTLKASSYNLFIFGNCSSYQVEYKAEE